MKGASDKVADSRMERWDYSFTRDSLHPKDESHRSNFSLFFFSIFLTTKSKNEVGFDGRKVLKKVLKKRSKNCSNEKVLKKVLKKR